MSFNPAIRDHRSWVKSIKQFILLSDKRCALCRMQIKLKHFSHPLNCHLMRNNVVFVLCIKMSF